MNKLDRKISIVRPSSGSEKREQSLWSGQISLKEYNNRLNEMASENPDRESIGETPCKKYNGALDTQVGGYHYKKYTIQPVEYAMANNLNYCQANAIKYITRYRDKNGIEDLRKAIHNIEILIELENGRTE